MTWQTRLSRCFFLVFSGSSNARTAAGKICAQVNAFFQAPPARDRKEDNDIPVPCSRFGHNTASYHGKGTRPSSLRCTDWPFARSPDRSCPLPHVVWHCLVPSFRVRSCCTWSYVHPLIAQDATSATGIPHQHIRVIGKTGILLTGIFFK